MLSIRPRYFKGLNIFKTTLGSRCSNSHHISASFIKCSAVTMSTISSTRSICVKNNSQRIGFHFYSLQNRSSSLQLSTSSEANLNDDRSANKHPANVSGSLKKKLSITFVSLGLLFLIDQFFYDKTFQRNLRTLWNGLIITIDYKLNFQPGKADQIHDLQKRVAERILNVCKENGGLYIKFGQQIASLNHVLPPEWNQTFKILYDDAPTVSFYQVKRLIEEDFGKSIEDLFIYFEQEPIASASIAQVHKATLPDGTPVAVKIQKPYLANQMEWDLRNYALVTWLFEKLFDLPLYWSVEYVQNHIRTEVNFLNEGQNAERAYRHILEVPELKENCYVPKVYWNHTSKRVLTCEWIDGIKFGDKSTMEKHGFNVQNVMETVVKVFADQIFRAGFIHCDPHPGNILLRKNPQYPKKDQIVLLDHGLYASCSPSFKVDYALFWKSLFTLDIATLDSIARSWGIQDTQMFASATLQRPWNPKKKLHVQKRSYDLKDVYEMQVKAKERVKEFLNNTELLPRELIFVGRNLNLIRSNNKALGSPVNRINIMADVAVQNLDINYWNLKKGSINVVEANNVSIRENPGYFSNLVSTYLIKYNFNYLIFKTTLFISSLTFHLNQIYQKLASAIFGIQSLGFEERLDNSMKDAMYEQFGIVIDESAFEA